MKRILAVALAVLAAGCTADDLAAPTTGSMSAPGQESAVYLLFDGYPVAPGPYLVPVARPGEPDLATALHQLVGGATESERAAGLSSAVPEGTRVLGVEVEGGVALVDLSVEFESGGGSLSVLGRVAQVVFTATAFEGVSAVSFAIAGRPVEVLSAEGLVIDRPQTRDDYLDLLPPIHLDQPAWGSKLGSPAMIVGSAVAATGSFEYTLIDAKGEIVAEGTVDLPNPGERTLFEESIQLPDALIPGGGAIVVYEQATDGTQQSVLELPLVIGR